MPVQGTHNVEYYVDIARDMIERYELLRFMQEQIDRMSRLEWDLPAGLPDWARPFKTTAPFDAVKAGVRVLSGLEEDITIDPFGFEEFDVADLSGAQTKANDWEVALKWQMDKAARRRAILRQDVTRSALLYDEIVGQVVHLPTQIKLIKKLGGNTNRQAAALRHGDFAILLRNPQQVYTKYSDYMLEAVLYAAVKTPEQIQMFWNNDELGKLIEDEEAAKKWIVFDYVDYGRRVVFCWPGEHIHRNTLGTNIDEEGEAQHPAIELLNEPWELDFLPWAAVVGGTMLDSAPDKSRFPLLYGILNADQWNNTNILGTLVLSEAIAEAARPDVARSGIQPDSVTADYGEVGGTWDVPAGHEVTPMPQMGLDPALREALDRQISDMARATIPQVLVTAEAGPEEPFAGFNLRIQQAMASLMPYKFLAERWFEDAYRLMLYWAKESNMAIAAPGAVAIEPADIDKDRIYLSVELQQDVPIDKQQRMATAIQAAKELKMPTRDVLEMLGETDPERKIKAWMQEQMEMAYFQGVLQHIAFESQQAIEEAMAQAQLQAQIQQAQQQIQGAAQQAQQQIAQQQQGPPQADQQEPGPNPAAGEAPPDGAEPGASSPPQATGADAAGLPVAG